MHGTVRVEPAVRLAKPEDEEEVMSLCRMLHAENGLFTLNENKVRGVLQKHYQKQYGIVGVIGPSGGIEATICLLISDFYYTDDWHLAELWNYVHPHFRNSHNARHLLRYMKNLSDELHLPLVTGIISNHRTDEKVRLYQRELGRPSGAFFVHNGNWVNKSEDPPVTGRRARSSMEDVLDVLKSYNDIPAEERTATREARNLNNRIADLCASIVAERDDFRRRAAVDEARNIAEILHPPPTPPMN